MDSKNQGKKLKCRFSFRINPYLLFLMQKEVEEGKVKNQTELIESLLKKHFNLA